MSSSSGSGVTNNHLACSSTSSAAQPDNSTAHNENSSMRSTSQVPQPQHVNNEPDAIASTSYNLTVNDETQMTEYSLENLFALTDVDEQYQLISDAHTNAPVASYVHSPAQLPTDDGASILCNFDFPQASTPQLPTDLQDISETQQMRLQPIGNPSELHPCPDCNVVCSHLERLRRHAEIHQYQFRCLICNKRYLRNQLLAHTGWAHPPHGVIAQSDEDNGLFPCDKCDIVCADAGARERHAVEHTYLTCSSCSKRFVLNEDLAAHACTSGVAESRPTPNYTQLYECTWCDKKFVFKVQFDQHVRVHERLELRRNGVKCSNCNLKCRNEEILNQHMMVHGYKLVCLLCDRRFIGDDELTAHSLVDHPFQLEEQQDDDPPFVRSFVGSSGDATTRRTPEAGQFDGDEKFVCEWPRCGKSFAYTASLARHMKNHTSEKKFVCQLCGKKFMRNDHLTSHMKRKHKRENRDDDEDDEDQL